MSYSDYLAGLRDGMAIGFEAGVRVGWKAGRRAGYLAGYEDGYSDAMCGLPYRPETRLRLHEIRFPEPPKIDFDSYRIPEPPPLPIRQYEPPPCIFPKEPEIDYRPYDDDCLYGNRFKPKKPWEY